ncbi:hypothetical protein LH464_14310 [Neorhizobium sp. T786]|uniref:hypothetical protein n=1 Tax=Pseudorhizobium xiangyangii TaxID=2883104 RepID=UPI001CFFFCE4|nr:hypothetical protein [Neorhizobium xiangyangii]MCB5203648.1 hypothetical protein [Neorhizobium xiangyangii]
MQEEMKIYRLVPTAAPDDPNWQNSPSQGEITVRARSTGDARVVASGAELDFTEVDALPAEGNSTEMASAFRNEKLYTVILDESGRFPVEGSRMVVDGQVRVDNIVPTQVD